jgi:hypothetical protein
VRIPEDERTEFHNRDEARKVENFGIRVPTVNDARQIEELSALVDLGPKPLFKGLLGRT